MYTLLANTLWQNALIVVAVFAAGGVGSMIGQLLDKAVGINPDESRTVTVKKEVDTGYRVGGKRVTKEIDTTQTVSGGLFTGILGFIGAAVGFFLALKYVVP